MKYQLIIYFLSVCSCILISCTTPTTQIITGLHKVDSQGNITPIEDEMDPLHGINKVFLSRIGDKAIIYYPVTVYFDVRIDTSISTIATYFNFDKNQIIYEVIEKRKDNIEFNDLCDISIIPDININLNIIENYNTNPKNKNKYKLIIVPIFDSKCKVNGYLVRFDLKGIPSKCESIERIRSIEKSFDDCSKGGSDCKCKPQKHCDCLEYKYFGKCCLK